MYGKILIYKNSYLFSYLKTDNKIKTHTDK